MLVSEFISLVRTGLRNVDIDGWIPSAYIHNKGLIVAELFIKREADRQALSKQTDMWSTLTCLEMEEVPLIECCGISIPGCTTVMKSKQEIPEVYATNKGYLLNLSTIDYSRDYRQTTVRQFKYAMDREYADKNQRYFWIENGHLIVPYEVTRVRLRGMFKNKAQVLRMNLCNKDAEACISFLDQEFVAPGHIMEDIVDATVLKIANVWAKMQQDELPNMNSNEKTNPTKI